MDVFASTILALIAGGIAAGIARLVTGSKNAAGPVFLLITIVVFKYVLNHLTPNPFAP